MLVRVIVCSSFKAEDYDVYKGLDDIFGLNRKPFKSKFPSNCVNS